GVARAMEDPQDRDPAAVERQIKDHMLPKRYRAQLGREPGEGPPCQRIGRDALESSQHLVVIAQPLRLAPRLLGIGPDVAQIDLRRRGDEDRPTLGGQSKARGSKARGSNGAPRPSLISRTCSSRSRFNAWKAAAPRSSISRRMPARTTSLR